MRIVNIHSLHQGTMHLILQKWISGCVLLLIIVVVSWGGTSCKHPVNTYENNLGVKPAVLAQVDSANFTVINWKDSVQDFGSIDRGDSLKLNFKFENTGMTGLFILEARPSCGCTNLQYPEEIILPSGTGEVKATFASGSQPVGAVYKTIFVKTNTLNSMRHLLVFKGEIKKGKLSTSVLNQNN